MGQLSLLLPILGTVTILMSNLEFTTGEKEVLVRDRLVFLLCDQLTSYMETGMFPDPIKVMPEKYKKIKPGQGGRAFGVKMNRTKGRGMMKSGKKVRKGGKSVRKQKYKRDVSSALLNVEDHKNFGLTVFDLFGDE